MDKKKKKKKIDFSRSQNKENEIKINVGPKQLFTFKPSQTTQHLSLYIIYSDFNFPVLNTTTETTFTLRPRHRKVLFRYEDVNERGFRRRLRFLPTFLFLSAVFSERPVLLHDSDFRLCVEEKPEHVRNGRRRIISIWVARCLCDSCEKLSVQIRERES